MECEVKRPRPPDSSCPSHDRREGLEVHTPSMIAIGWLRTLVDTLTSRTNKEA